MQSWLINLSEVPDLIVVRHPLSPNGMNSFFTHMNDTNNAASLVTNSIVPCHSEIKTRYFVVGTLRRLHQAIPTFKIPRQHSLSTLTLTYMLRLRLPLTVHHPAEDNKYLVVMTLRCFHEAVSAFRPCPPRPPPLPVHLPGEEDKMKIYSGRHMG